MPKLLVFEVGVHYIDVMRFLFGDIKRIFAHTAHQSTLVKGEDLAVLMMTFDDEMFGIIDISWGSYVPEEYRGARGAVEPFVVEGDLGTIELDPYDDDSLIVTTAAGTQRRHARPGITRAEAYQQSYLQTHTNFIQCLRTGTQAENRARENLKTLSATLAAYESAEHMGWIDLADAPSDQPSPGHVGPKPSESWEETLLSG